MRKERERGKEIEKGEIVRESTTVLVDTCRSNGLESATGGQHLETRGVGSVSLPLGSSFPPTSCLSSSGGFFYPPFPSLSRSLYSFFSLLGEGRKISLSARVKTLYPQLYFF